MQCPVCDGTTLVMAERQGVEIDCCPKCRGVWLDRAELDKIVERSRPQGAPARHDDREPASDRHGSHEHQRRKKSWLGDIFD
ncbi:MAG: zf-TFIIB domain-containing protein [Polyangiaceae bacterium]|nr:zf-TFIIB domain-containing protein [Polyangiaceae bacterium]